VDKLGVMVEVAVGYKLQGCSYPPFLAQAVDFSYKAVVWGGLRFGG
jgi:hypothetical protein